jgi:hypothetical protein
MGLTCAGWNDLTVINERLRRELDVRTAQVEVHVQANLRLERELAEVQAENDQMSEKWNDIVNARYRAERELAEAQRDAGRYRDIRNNRAAREALKGDCSPEELDAAIDAAMAEPAPSPPSR